MTTASTIFNKHRRDSDCKYVDSAGPDSAKSYPRELLRHLGRFPHRVLALKESHRCVSSTRRSSARAKVTHPSQNYGSLLKRQLIDPLMKIFFRVVAFASRTGAPLPTYIPYLRHSHVSAKEEAHHADNSSQQRPCSQPTLLNQ